MNRDKLKLKKTILLNIPYIVVGLFGTKIGQMWRLAEGADLLARFMDAIAYLIRQSFKPGKVTPEEANRIGYTFAERFLKGKHAFLFVPLSIAAIFTTISSGIQPRWIVSGNSGNSGTVPTQSGG